MNVLPIQINQVKIKLRMLEIKYFIMSQVAKAIYCHT